MSIILMLNQVQNTTILSEILGAT